MGFKYAVQRPWSLISMALALLFLLLFVAPTYALADSGAPPAGEVVLGIPIWPVLTAGIALLVTYLVNHFAFWGSEPAKAIFMLVGAAANGALTQLVDAGTVGFDSNTLKYVLGAVVGALLLHFGVYKPGGVNVALGAGKNANGTLPRAAVGLGK